MKKARRMVAVIALLGGTVGSAAEVGTLATPTCKMVRAELIERRSTVGCKPEHSFCFLGEVDGNRGFRGTTYFRGDSAANGPSGSPNFRSYSGTFEYTTDRGVLIARETGVVNSTQGAPDSGALTAYQQIVVATGELTGVTGHFFVSGFNRDGQIDTIVNGTLCYPD